MNIYLTLYGNKYIATIQKSVTVNVSITTNLYDNEYYIILH